MTPAARPAGSDAAVRERIRTSLAESLIVEASAGTGKTSELVKRIVNVLAAGAKAQGIVAVTFTHKAAGELKIRLRQALDEARGETAGATELANLEDALAHLEEASIGTIHGFCAQILRERPVEARIDPEFGELTEVEAARLFDRAFDRWFQDRLNAPSPGLRRALARLAHRDSWEIGSPIEQLKFAGRKLVEWRDFTAPWKQREFERDHFVGLILDRVRSLAGRATQAKRANDALVASIRPARALVEAIERTGSTPDFDVLEALLLKLQRDLKRRFRKGSGLFADGLSRETVVAECEQLLHTLDLFRQASGADLAAQLRDEMRGLIDSYDDLKKRSGRLDFLDLLLMARDLVRDDTGVRRYLQDRFTHVFVDEFQDTDPLQAEILILLSADDPDQNRWLEVKPIPGKLFVVGDPKQSIYKFRRADVNLYQQICERLESRGVARVTLTTSFRSVRPIQQFVNAAFETEMTGDVNSGQAHYAPLEQHCPPYEDQPAIVALPAPQPYGFRGITKNSLDACLPDAIAAFVEWLVGKSGWRVRDQESGERVPVRARHICILFRRFMNFGADVTRHYVRSLETRGIPHLLVGSRSFHQREEVETLRAALTAIEWPEDELSVFATLKGALFAISDDLLLRFRHEATRLHPFRPFPENLGIEFAPIRDALTLLADLHRGRNWRPIADTINQLLEATRAHAGFALRPAGAQVLANIYRVCDLARGFELSGGFSFRGFVEEFTRQAEKSESAEAPVLEEASDGVRLMTVHTAKGLEFPVVILADMTANLTAAEPDRYLDPEAALCATRLLRCAPWDLLEHDQEELEREKAEGVRVAYVAATRARDLLVVPSVGDEEREGWLAPLNKALYPHPKASRQSRAATGCPPFRGDATVLDRPPEFGSSEVSVKPGLHAPRVGEHGVVWWDPTALRLNVPEKFGLEQEDILAADPADRAEEGIRRYRNWREQRQRILTQGATPQFEIVTATEIAEAPPEAAPIVVESLPRAEKRPFGWRFGTLVHAILRDADLARNGGQTAALAKAHGRLLNASEEEIAAAEESARAALGHPILQRARAAARCSRELPLMLRLEDGRLFEGIADLAFLENDSWTVADFKSDAELRGVPGKYERQLQWYVFALSRMTGSPARGVLLRV